MNDVEHGVIDTSGDAGCRYLALRVIEQAFRDLTGAAGTRADRESARGFLAGSPIFYRWCEIASVSAAVTIARATMLAGVSSDVAPLDVTGSSLVRRSIGPHS